MKKSLTSVFFSLGILASALEITGDFPIVVTVDAVKNTPEDKAPLVLQEHLSKIFGKEVAVIPASKWEKNSPAIVLRRDSRLDKEEWLIETNGKYLSISGGQPRGVFYGVCEFLEQFGGVRWFTTHEIKIPRKNVLKVPDNHVFRRKPAFPLKRHISSSLVYREYERSRACLKLTCVTAWGWPSLFNTRRIGLGHNYWKLTSAVPRGMERMLPVDKFGKPQRGIGPLGPGQVCFSNPEFRAFAKKEVAKWVAEEEKFLKGRSPDYRAQWIVLIQNDKYDDFCCCKGCKELIRKYGSVSGAQLEFINDIASAFPNYMILTSAYQLTQKPPKNIRARDNVLIQPTFLSDSDLLRPISHPNNAGLRKQYEGWRKVARNLAIYTYHRLYHMTEAFPWPQCCYWNIAENIRYYHNNLGAIKLYIQSEYREKRDGVVSRAFNDLHNYLECKMMDDPMQDDKPIIEEFFQYQYGPAVQEMKAYAALLKKRIDAVPGIVSDKPIKMRGIMDAEFFKTVNDLFAKAEAKAGQDQGLLIRIAMERIPVDFAAINMWDQGGSACGISRTALIDRLEKNIKLFLDRYQPEKWRKYGGISYADCEKETFDILKLLRSPLPVPAEFAKEDVIQIPVYGSVSIRILTDDPDAAYGKAVKLGKVRNAKYDHAKYPMMFGLYDHTAKKSILERIIRKEEIPQDEKTYRLYYLGRHVPNGLHKERLWGHRSWQLGIEYLYKNKLWDPMDDTREYDIYISCKLTGPAYVKGSKKENAVYVDKLLAVKRGTRMITNKKKPKTAQKH